MSLDPFGTARRLFARDTAVRDFDVIRANIRLFGLEEPAVHLASEAAAWQKDLDAGGHRAAMLLVLCALISVNQGSTRFPVRGPDGKNYLRSVIGQLTGDQSMAVTVLDRIESLMAGRRLPELIGAPGDFRPLILDDPYLYPQRMYELENRFVEEILRQAGAPVPAFGNTEIDRHLRQVDGMPLKLSKEQREAVRTAVRFPLTVVSGGPGTGKTSVVVSVLRVLCRLGVEPAKIALAAPTGKASNRMAEAIRGSLVAGDEVDAAVMNIPPPRTLHRLLGYSPASRRFGHHENNRLAEQVVIVDETSMVDLFLMERLLRSLRADARLVLIGDAGQLPPVDAGAVLRDLMPDTDGRRTYPLHRCVVRLRKNFRVNGEDPGGAAITAAADAIRAGEDGIFGPAAKQGRGIPVRAVEDLRFEGVEMADDGDNDRPIGPFLSAWYDSRIKATGDFERLVRKEYRFGRDRFSGKDVEDLELLFGHFRSSRVLCVTRVYETGADSVNRYFHRKMREEVGLEFFPDFVPGEPVLMEHNDYTRNIFNGDQGIVLRVRDQSGQQHFMAVFRLPEGFTAFHIDSLRSSITHAFAMTVHKSQGSEFDHVALILPRQEMPLLTRELLYTAVTRARKSVTILGSRRILTKAVQNPISRFSGIAETLRPPEKA